MNTRLAWSLVVATVVAGAPATTYAAGPADPRGALIHRSTDPVSGAVVRLYQPVSSKSVMTLEVEKGSVKVSKKFEPAGSRVTIVSGKDSISFTMTPGLLVVSSPAGEARLTPADAEATHAKVERLVRASAAHRDGLMLLTRLRVPQRSALNMLILPTRAFLEGPLGETTAWTEMTRWVRAVAAAKPKIVKAAYQKEPGECWELYAQEVIEAWIEFEDCMTNAPWQGWPWDTNCKTIYTIRAVGAAAWWAKCVAIT